MHCCVIYVLFICYLRDVVASLSLALLSTGGSVHISGCCPMIISHMCPLYGSPPLFCRTTLYKGSNGNGSITPASSRVYTAAPHPTLRYKKMFMDSNRYPPAMRPQVWHCMSESNPVLKSASKSSFDRSIHFVDIILMYTSKETAEQLYNIVYVIFLIDLLTKSLYAWCKSKRSDLK